MAVQTNRGMTSENEMKEQDMAPVFNINAPKYGTVVPNRVFVGGITSATTENDLNQLFSNYGKVINAKIIVDRAGVSRGYGFVTFESDEEARRLQKDADNIVLKERKLNIAPAIKKQVQPVYTTSGPGSPSQYSSYIHRQNGVVSSYAYMNSLTYFPQQAAQQSAPMTPLPSNHVEPSVYPGNYPALPQCNSPPSYQYGYPQQAPIFIPHYPLAVPQYDGCYQGELQNGYAQPGMESNNQVAYPQYFVSQQHPEITYYQQPVGVPQELVYTQRTYDSSTVYFTEVPQIPTYYASRPYMNQSQPYYQRKPFQRGKFSAKSKKYRDETEPEDEDVCEIDQLTPPITPISPKQHDISESEKKDDLIQSFDNLKM